MRKTVGCLIVLSLLVLLSATALAGAGPTKPRNKVTRVESYEYSGPTSAELPVTTMDICLNAQDASNACITLDPLKGEQYIAVEVTDSTETPVSFAIELDGLRTVYCGTATEIPLDKVNEVNLKVLVTSGSCSGVGTAGSIDVIFSNLP